MKPNPGFISTILLYSSYISTKTSYWKTAGGRLAVGISIKYIMITLIGKKLDWFQKCETNRCQCHFPTTATYACECVTWRHQVVLRTNADKSSQAHAHTLSHKLLSCEGKKIRRHEWMELNGRRRKETAASKRKEIKRRKEKIKEKFLKALRSGWLACWWG